MNLRQASNWLRERKKGIFVGIGGALLILFLFYIFKLDVTPVVGTQGIFDSTLGRFYNPTELSQIKVGLTLIILSFILGILFNKFFSKIYDRIFKNPLSKWISIGILAVIIITFLSTIAPQQFGLFSGSGGVLGALTGSVGGFFSIPIAGATVAGALFGIVEFAPELAIPLMIVGVIIFLISLFVVGYPIFQFTGFIFSNAKFILIGIFFIAALWAIGGRK